MTDEQALAAAQQNDHVALAAKFMDQQGIKYDIVTTETPQEDGTVKVAKAIRILQVPEAYMAITRFFSDPDAPCDFPGCTAFQKEFKVRVQAAGGAACPSCDRGRIIREMTPRVQAAMGIKLDKPEPIMIQSPQKDEHNKENNSTTIAAGPVAVPGPRSEGHSGTQGRSSLLRRAAAYIKKVFRVST